RVEKVVGEVATVLGQALSDLGLRLGGHVLPDGAVVQGDLRLERPVRVDLVAGVDEEVRLTLAHDLVEAHPTPARVDAPALAGLVTGVREGDRATSGRCGPEAAGQGCAHHPRIGEILEVDPAEDLLAGREATEVDARREVAVAERSRADDTAHVPEGLG